MEQNNIPIGSHAEQVAKDVLSQGIADVRGYALQVWIDVRATASFAENTSYDFAAFLADVTIALKISKAIGSIAL